MEIINPVYWYRYYEELDSSVYLRVHGTSGQPHHDMIYVVEGTYVAIEYWNRPEPNVGESTGWTRITESTWNRMVWEVLNGNQILL